MRPPVPGLLPVSKVTESGVAPPEHVTLTATDELATWLFQSLPSVVKGIFRFPDGLGAWQVALTEVVTFKAPVVVSCATALVTVILVAAKAAEARCLIMDLSHISLRSLHSPAGAPRKGGQNGPYTYGLGCYRKRVLWVNYYGDGLRVAPPGRSGAGLTSSRIGLPISKQSALRGLRRKTKKTHTQRKTVLAKMWEVVSVSWVFSQMAQHHLKARRKGARPAMGRETRL